MKLKNKVVVITGGNSGIGLGIAEEFKTEGALGAILGRDPETLEAAGKKLGENFLAVQGDLTKIDDIEKLYKETSEKFGNVDVLVVNAGVVKTEPLEAVDEASFDNMSNINFKGAFFTVQKALPHLNNGASVILVASIAQSKGFAGMSVYSATKAALRSLARTFSAELVGRGIRVNCISPGPIDTPIFDKSWPEEQVSEMKEGFKQMVPLKRMGLASEVAHAALFLASSDSSFILGEEIQVDGGMANL